jgi:hypothetical protein
MTIDVQAIQQIQANSLPKSTVDLPPLPPNFDQVNRFNQLMLQPKNTANPIDQLREPLEAVMQNPAIAQDPVAVLKAQTDLSLAVLNAEMASKIAGSTSNTIKVLTQGS